MSAIISDKFRIFNAEQFLSALGDDFYDEENQYIPGSPVERSRMYFFVGRPQRWYAFLEVYGVVGTFAEGETISSVVPGSNNNFGGRVEKVYESALLLSNITGNTTVNTVPVAGQQIQNGTGATAYVGLYRNGTEDAVPLALDNDAEFYDIYDDMIAAKRMTIEYTRGVVRRYTWSLSGSEVYDMYRHDYSRNATGLAGKPGSSTTGEAGAPATTLGTAKFYVLNQDYEVWKCIYNGSSGANPNGIPAVHPPKRIPDVGEGVYDDPDTGGSGLFFEDLSGGFAGGNYVVSPANGYIWKFMFKLPINDVLRFLSTDFMPIPLSQAANGSDRPQTESIAEDGAIHAVLIERATTSLSPGTYFAPIIGDGTGGIVRLTVAGGSITSLSIVDRGLGYTYASVPLANGQTVDGDPYGLYSDSGLTVAVSGLTFGTLGALEPIIGPRGGHGSDMESEFNTKRIMANIRLSYAEGAGDFPVDNDFRRIGILKDPESVAQAGPAIEQTLSNIKGIYVTNVGVGEDYVVDETITQTLSTGGVAEGRVVSWTNNGDGTGFLKYYQSRHEHTDRGVVRAFENSTTATNPVVGAESGASCDVFNFDATAGGLSFTDGLAASEFVRDTGDVIYLENRRLITRAPDQIEDIKLVIEF